MTFSVLGINTQTRQRVDILKSSRLQGMYIIGGTGQGKTGLIENLILQDIEQDIGVCLLDPHGDLTNSVLLRLPDRRIDDVVYLDISQYQYPFGLNLFACSDPANPLEIQRTVDQVMHVFEKLYDVSRDTPLLLQYLRNCTHTLVANPGYTLADIPLLFLNDQCRQTLVANVTDMDIRLFWQQYEYIKAGEQREEAA